MKEKEPEIDAGPAAKKRRQGFKNQISYDFRTYDDQTNKGLYMMISWVTENLVWARLN